MSDSLFIFGLAVLTSVAVSLAARGLGVVRARALRPAVLRLLECVGLAVGLYALNLAVGVLAVMALRRTTHEFVSVYITGDGTLPVLSALQAIVLQWWRAESGRDGA